MLSEGGLRVVAHGVAQPKAREAFPRHLLERFLDRFWSVADGGVVLHIMASTVGSSAIYPEQNQASEQGCEGSQTRARLARARHTSIFTRTRPLVGCTHWIAAYGSVSPRLRLSASAANSISGVTPTMSCSDGPLQDESVLALYAWSKKIDRAESATSRTQLRGELMYAWHTKQRDTFASTHFCLLEISGAVLRAMKVPRLSAACAQGEKRRISVTLIVRSS